MKLADHIRQADYLSFEDPLFEIPLRKEFLIKEIGKGRRVLDLGCLGGQISQLIREQNNEVYGVELNARAASVAETRGVRVKIFDLNDGIPFEDGFFDVVNAGRILENIYDTKYLFEECNRVLRSNGYFIFTFLNLNSLENRLRVLTGNYLITQGAYPEDFNGENIRWFNLEKIYELCNHTGFRIVSKLGIPAFSKNSLRYRMFRPLVRMLPQFGELLIIKAQRIDQ